MASKAVAVVTEGLRREQRILFEVGGGLLKDSEREWERLLASSPTVPLA